MTGQVEKELSQRYHAAPRVDSPTHLDQKILATAKANAPEKAGAWTSNWIPALATACVAGVVFYVASPLLEKASYDDYSASYGGAADSRDAEEARYLEADQVPAAAPAAKSTVIVVEESLMESNREAETVLQSNSAGQDDQEPGSKVAVSEKKEFAAEIAKQPAEKRAGVAAERKQDAAIASAQELRKDKAQFPGEESAETVAGALSTDSVTRKSLQGVLSDSVSISARNRKQPQIAVQPMRPPLSSAEVQLRLDRINALAEQQLIDEAEEMLAALIANCADCELPQSLAELKLSVEARRETEPE